MQTIWMLVAMGAMLFSGAAYAKPAFIAQDYSGVYDCVGHDAHEGEYTGTVTMKLKPEHSYEAYSSYSFTLKVPGFGTYYGYAAGNGNQLSIQFALPDQRTMDYGTGIAIFSTDNQGKVSFHKFYHEPEFKGGNTGTEDCVRR